MYPPASRAVCTYRRQDPLIYNASLDSTPPRGPAAYRVRTPDNGSTSRARDTESEYTILDPHAREDPRDRRSHTPAVPVRAAQRFPEAKPRPDGARWRPSMSPTPGRADIPAKRASGDPLLSFAAPKSQLASPAGPHPLSF
ncbi:uncharacterized protein TRAVEDRAFT_27484 [Trametes versicolor FP-101664 SS1]|uniref:uncharacterized protein n=1 Tax=Trametes versicolor (strain FP-101664) TaxID=717944 RepID=UPI00046237DC|nr:uncharacterized protein TRAVEDRAFT_27484 [Trametes versicolor FP-101664 SS1]EIW62111.1 hypothetical protein TRAVEDRAFT_27484 [Trametes versicolor FP-101664 SS1]